MKIVVSLLFILLLMLQANFWFGSHGVFQLWSLQNNTLEIQQRNDKLTERNETFHAEVKELESGKDALEERARNQLGFIKEGELFYHVIPGQKLKSN